MMRIPAIAARLALAAVVAGGLFSGVAVSRPAPAQAQNLGTCNWTGVWQAERFGELRLVQRGVNLLGVYQYVEDGVQALGQITGAISGNMAGGQWTESPTYMPPNDEGQFEFTISSDCRSIMGRYKFFNSSGWDGEWSMVKISD